ncbi:MAG: lipoate--protein ligase [Gemmatimonadaceae bacterium]|nr:lipoate--protein ligase [Gemmatimonadaceae bacterium]
MRFIDNLGITDPTLNLALEEYVLRHKPADEDCLLFYVNAPSIIIGRNQNTIEEINTAVVDARGITVVRRISGGGAVYHDLGNLNFSFITPFEKGRFNRYDHFTKPVLSTLHALGVPAELGGRNDILAGGRKISGNAQFATATRMFSHGTLLFDSNLDDVTEALRPKPGKVESKGVKSIRSRVANISEFVREPITVGELRERLLEEIFGTRDRSAIPSIEITEQDWDQVRQLRARKYGNRAWNFGEDPKCNVQRTKRFPAGEIDARIDVQQARIAQIRFFGDYMGRLDVATLEALLAGVAYDAPSVAVALSAVDVQDYFGDVSHAEVVELIVP